MSKPQVFVLNWLPPGMLERWRGDFPECDFVEAGADQDRSFAPAAVLYGLPAADRLAEAANLRWIQLTSAGVAPDLCAAARERDLLVTNLAGLYGPSIAEHALALMTVLSRHLQQALRNQLQGRWDRDVARNMADLQGRTMGIIGLGHIGRAIARLGRCYGMRVIGCRRTDRLTPYVDRVYPMRQLHALLAEADYLVVAAALTAQTRGLLGAAEFAACKRGVIYINVSRGPVAQEAALLEALDSGQVAAAGLDVYAVEPLPPEHPLWRLPQVMLTPHYSGEVVNNSSRPAERFARNLRSWLTGRPLEGVVNLEWGY